MVGRVRKHTYMTQRHGFRAQTRILGRRHTQYWARTQAHAQQDIQYAPMHACTLTHTLCTYLYILACVCAREYVCAFERERACWRVRGWVQHPSWPRSRPSILAARQRPRSMTMSGSGDPAELVRVLAGVATAPPPPRPPPSTPPPVGEDGGPSPVSGAAARAPPRACIIYFNVCARVYVCV